MYIILTDSGTRVELPENASVTIKKTNNSLQFGQYELSRTSIFQLPLTRANRLAVGLAEKPEVTGEQMRRKYKAQLVANSVVYDGYLYITRANKEGCSATFIFGDLLAVKNLFERGKLNKLSGNRWVDAFYGGMPQELVSEGGMHYFIDGTNPVQIPTSEVFTDEEQVRLNCVPRPYVNAISGKLDAPKNNAVSMDIAMRYARDNGVEITPPSGDLVAVEPHLVGLQEFTISTYLTITTLDEWSSESKRYTTPAINGVYFNPYRLSYRDNNSSVGDVLKTNAVDTLSFGGDAVVQMPSDLPDDVFIVSPITMQSIYPVSYTSTIDMRFWGDYKLDADLNVIGEPLAGRAVELQRYTQVKTGEDESGNDVYEWRENFFFFISKNDINIDYTGEQCGISRPYTATMELTVSVKDAEQTNFSFWRVGDQLPPITFAELVQVYCQVYGVYPIINEGSITFAEASDLSNVVNCDRYYIETDSVERVVKGFAKTNTIKFEKNDSLAVQPQQVWEVDNDTIDDEKTLYTLPFVPGLQTENGLYIDDMEVDEDGKVVSKVDKYTLARIQENGDLKIAEIARREDITRITEASTYVKMLMYMPMYDFNRIFVAGNVIQVGGVRYIWTSAQWNKNKVTVEMQKI